MSVKARMIVQSILDLGTQKNVKMTAVTTGDSSSPNYSFSKYTPSATLEISITNPGAYNQFEVGKSYDLTFEPTPVEEKPAA